VTKEPCLYLNVLTKFVVFFGTYIQEFAANDMLEILYQSKKIHKEKRVYVRPIVYTMDWLCQIIRYITLHKDAHRLYR